MGRPAHHGDTDDQDLAQIARQEIGRETPDIGIDQPTLADGMDDGRKGVVAKDEIRRLAGDLRAALSHGDADIGLSQGRGVVDPSPVMATTSPAS